MSKKTNSIAREHVLALSLAFYEPNPRTITFTSWFPWLWFLLSIPMYSRNSFLTQIFRMKNDSWKQEFTTKFKYIYVLNRPFWSLQLRQCRPKNFHLSLGLRKTSPLCLYFNGLTYIHIETGHIPGRKGNKIYYPSALYSNSALEVDIYKNVPDNWSEILVEIKIQ